MRLIIVMAFMGHCWGQSPSPTEKLDVGPPVISDALRAEFWRSQAEAISANAQAEKAKAKMDAAQAKLVAACGDKYQPAPDQTGEPVCVPKPDPKAK